MVKKYYLRKQNLEGKKTALSFRHGLEHIPIQRNILASTKKLIAK